MTACGRRLGRKTEAGHQTKATNTVRPKLSSQLTSKNQARLAPQPQGRNAASGGMRWEYEKPNAPSRSRRPRRLPYPIRSARHRHSLRLRPPAFPRAAAAQGAGSGVLSRHDKPRERGGSKGPKLSIETQWVSNPTRKRLATPGSEFCVVVSNGGTKRKQPVLKPCE